MTPQEHLDAIRSLGKTLRIACDFLLASELSELASHFMRLGYGLCFDDFGLYIYGEGDNFLTNDDTIIKSLAIGRYFVIQCIEPLIGCCEMLTQLTVLTVQQQKYLDEIKFCTSQICYHREEIHRQVKVD